MTRTLLLADDSVTIQRVVELTFAEEDITVVAVSDGDQAIARIDASPPDIVLADIGMPGRTGYEVAQYIKQSSRLAHIPVVLLAGAFEPVDHARATAAGCDGVLAKPFEPQLVIARVKELLARSGSEETPAAAAVVDTPRSPDLVRLDNYFESLDAALASLPETSSNGVPISAAPAPPSAPKVPSPLADAFAALLAAERQQPLPALASTWPAWPGGAPSNDLIEEVTRRVLARLSESLVRERVADVMSSVAERLVREEIDRIKSSIT